MIEGAPTAKVSLLDGLFSSASQAVTKGLQTAADAAAMNLGNKAAIAGEAITRAINPPASAKESVADGAPAAGAGGAQPFKYAWAVVLLVAGALFMKYRKGGA